MGPGLEPIRTREPSPGDVPETVPVREVIDLDASYHLDHEPGVVLVLDAFVVEDVSSLIGQYVQVRTASRRRRLRIDDARDHGTTISLFFGGLTSADVPVGSLVEVGACRKG